MYCQSRDERGYGIHSQNGLLRCYAPRRPSPVDGLEAKLVELADIYQAGGTANVAAAIRCSLTNGGLHGGLRRHFL